MPFGWTCSTCTYYHSYPGERCVMCNELRVTKQQMIDFKKGVPIPKDDGKPPPADAAAAKKGGKLHPVKTKQARLDTLPPKSSNKGTAVKRSNSSDSRGVTNNVLNPYSSKAPLSTAAQRQAAPQASNVPMGATVPPKVHQTVSNPPISKQAGVLLPDAVRKPPPQSNDNSSNIKKTIPPVQSAQQQQKPMDQTTTTNATNPFELATKQRQRMPVLVYQPGPVSLNAECAHEWIYPSHDNYPKRQYQLEISQTAIFHNTLVSLPTGLGKTLIAAVVLYNYYRWFPAGKVIFMAPTLPLVNQQVKACYDIMGIPAHVTAVLTGKCSPERRQEIWQERSVFFCTPQTVQKDLYAGRCQGDQVVCVVLDEAHKATGDYAYVKVLEYLEQSGAKFRVLGLSATPGANIKAIQQVIDALGISKIEARTDSDPSVAQYTHERRSEIVIVKQKSASKTIEYVLNDMIGPLLDRLRSAGALTRLTGNATVTPYHIVRAKEEYVKRGGDGSVLGYFHAARTFIQLREWLHRQGVGVVRLNLLPLRNEPQRGLMATIVKGEDFQRLWAEVAKATCDPNSSQANAQEMLANNPKLTKLQEILTEHFERAKACSTSSRAIVFSQFRDSVSEIVSVLKSSEPLIRPRHFIGQGKGAKGDGTTVQLKGMRQSEQHDVIREFRADIYNVLVCTCIGEEGLDIGEVDLIVNFDTLRNPIRMIQRVGRTGRKREGRVVLLVAEGPEERTLNASRQAERTLNHAFKNPKSFKCLPTRPMFPSNPVLVERSMLVSQNFHISQVEGHGGGAERGAKSHGGKSAGRQHSSIWRLSESDNARRIKLLGKFGALQVGAASQLVLPTLRRRLLFGRNTSASRRKSNKVAIGRTAQLLRHVESSHPMPETTTRVRGSRGEERSLRALFPLMPTDVPKDLFDHTTEDSLSSGNRDSPLGTAATLAVEGTATNLHAPSFREISSKSGDVPGEKSTSSSNAMAVEKSTSSSNAMAVEKSTSTSNTMAVEAKKSVSRQDSNREAAGRIGSHQTAPHLARQPMQVINRYASRSHGTNRKDSKTASQSKAESSTEQHQSKVMIDQSIQANALDTSEGPSVAEGPPPVAENRSQFASLSPEVFHLPTPPDSSSSEDEEEEDRDYGENVNFAVGSSVNEQLVSEANAPTMDKPDSGLATDGAHLSEENGTTEMDEFRLPTQESSSSSEDESETCDVDSKEEDRKESAPLLSPRKTKEELQRQENESTKSQMMAIGESSESHHESQGSGCVRFSDMHAKSFAPHSAASEGTNDLPDGGETLSQDVQLPRNKNAGRKVLAIDDTPDADSAALSVPTHRSSAVNNALMDTQLSDFADTQQEEKNAQPPRKKHAKRKVLAIDDTPATDSGTLSVRSRRSSSFDNNALMDTQPCELADRKAGQFEDVDDIVCAVCFSGDSPDDNPIILCDGQSGGVSCNLAVHVSCYSVTKNLLSDEEWRCDPCQYLYTGGTGVIKCSACQSTDGLIKRLSANEWKHIDCESKKAQMYRLKRLRKKADGQTERLQENADGGRRPLARLLVNADDNKGAPGSSRKRRRKAYAQFIDEEAAVDSEEDMDGDRAEEDNIEAIEEEEAFNRSFINDSSQLGYTQDDPERLDPDANANDDTVHRDFDIEQERMQQFATPALNRRHLRRKREGNCTDTPLSAPSSEKGLGNMHFIRSVLEHQRHGGRVEEIEEFYQQLEREEVGDIDEDNLVPEPPLPNRTVMHYEESESEENS